MFLTTLLQEVVEPELMTQAFTLLGVLLGFPVVTSAVTSGLRYLTGSGVNPRYVVWAVGLAITGLFVYTGDIAIVLPEWGGDIESYFTAWLSVGTLVVKLAQGYYDLILSRLPILAGPSE